MSNRGRLTEADVDEAMREVRRALLEADVNFKVVRDFVAAVRERAVGEEVLKSLTPAQTVISIVHDELIKMLGEERSAAGHRRAQVRPSSCWSACRAPARRPTLASWRSTCASRAGTRCWSPPTSTAPPPSSSWRRSASSSDIPVYSEGADEKPLKIVQQCAASTRATRARIRSSSTPPAACRSTTP